ncbi:MalY/PatB family protein [Aquibacillus albus]|uniref:cysteine-S-conjugate beta-lyase n=1 Tax=Aquibacillus albus TaxID=1168171 RepID=A0ABS2MYE3_9BACI|nr:MalY/PatB family protein [Aquibacillus albus]MBM7570919.1 cystathionine beta-lyase [Aquibacillus albus]
MTFFEKVPNRKETRSVKWDLVKSIYGADDVLPMWVADMDFPVPTAVTEALVKRAQHGIFGYTYTDPSVNHLICKWVKKRHNWDINPSSLIYSPGVITTLHMAIQTFTNKDDAILIQTPVYPPFYDVVKKHNRTLITNPLVLKNGRYEIDFPHFEAQLKQGVKAFILCNPHNPVGRVWTKEELQQMADLCLKYNVTIFSDEIHADIVYSDYKHIPIASLSEEISKHTITCMSPTKTFNLAGLQASFAIVSDKAMRVKLNDQLKRQGVIFLNTMGVTALEAAYRDGENWLEELLEVLERNKTLVSRAFEGRNDVSIIEPEGTYLIWMDCRQMNLPHEEIKKFMQENAKVGLNDGISFGEEGSGFMRINIACPTTIVKQGLDRILTALNNRKE